MKKIESSVFKKHKLNRTHKIYRILSKKPLIILTYEHLETGSIAEMSKLIKKNKAYILVGFWTHRESEVQVKKLNKVYIDYKKNYPNYKLIFLCNSLVEYSLLGKYDLPRVFFNQNCLIDENIFKINKQIKKRYDAIYNGRLRLLKRHYLAKNIRNLALLTYQLYYIPKERRRKYFDQVKKELSNAIMLNYDGKPHLKDCLFLSPFPRKSINEVSDYLNEARVGLMLSAEEGACYASCEYLLCGLPVVSTKNKGGRDVFFDRKYVKIVDDDSEAVAKGVKEMIKRNIDPQYIRNKTLKKMEKHRKIFIKLIQDIFDKEDINKNFEKEWNKIFRNKMVEYVKWPPEDFEFI